MNHETSNHETPKKRHHGKKVLRIVGMTLVGIIFAVLFALVFGFVVKILWNWLMPAIFGVGSVSYWQAFGLVVLAKLLFGSFGHRHNGHHDHFHKKIDDKWHRFIGIEDAECAPKGSHKNWKYYSRYWKDEGKAAFEAYIDRMEAEKGKKED